MNKTFSSILLKICAALVLMFFVFQGEALALSYTKLLQWEVGVVLKIPKGWTSTLTNESSSIGYRSDFFLDIPDKTKNQPSIGKMVFTKVDNYTEYFGNHDKFTADRLAELQKKPGFKLISDKKSRIFHHWIGRKISYTYQNAQDPNLVETHVDLIGTIEKNLQMVEYYTVEPAVQSGKSQFKQYSVVYNKILRSAKRVRIIQGVPITY